MATDLTIHFMERSEEKQVVDLLDRVFGLEFPGTIEDAFSDDPYRPIYFSAVQDGKVVGTVTCHFLSEDLGLIGRLAVDPSERGKGIGNALMAHAENFMGNEWMHGKPGTVGLIDETKKTNILSQFYEHMGYAPDNSIPSTPESPYLVKHINNDPKPG